MRADTHEVNATILRLLGLDHTRLTYLYQGRNARSQDLELAYMMQAPILMARCSFDAERETFRLV